MSVIVVIISFMVDSAKLNKLVQEIQDFQQDELLLQQIEKQKQAAAQRKLAQSQSKAKEEIAKQREEVNRDIATPVEGEVKKITPSAGLKKKSFNSKSDNWLQGGSQDKFGSFELRSEKKVINGVTVVRYYQDGKVVNVVVETDSEKEFIFRGDPSTEKLKEAIARAQTINQIQEKQAREDRELMGTSQAGNISLDKTPLEKNNGGVVSLRKPKNLKKKNFVGRIPDNIDGFKEEQPASNEIPPNTMPKRVGRSVPKHYRVAGGEPTKINNSQFAGLFAEGMAGQQNGRKRSIAPKQGILSRIAKLFGR